MVDFPKTCTKASPEQPTAQAPGTPWTAQALLRDTTLVRVPGADLLTALIYAAHARSPRDTHPALGVQLPPWERPTAAEPWEWWLAYPSKTFYM